ncbi:helix-turn-helix domain-containing protein [Sporosarcina sp. YIM B06819]|uniref:helix-turn-helix domain-containing protein n=1 Tax=Sporosarcina sp. YIM B06819 TaxID=3081769 RepID=UPI00298C8938|nr:helix-turn-helix domain-containing protein [Sporosarcina sp. YIM B06819]
MNLSLILLSIIHKLDGERTIYAGFHLLRGKRSGQTLQDVEYYGLKAFFGILPKLTVDQFNEAATLLKNSGFIATRDDSFVNITEQGRQLVATLPAYAFNGWDYRGRENLFFARLSLIVQTVSHFKEGQHAFMPVQKDYDSQSFVKTLLHHQPISDPAYARYIAEELRLCIERSGMDNEQKIIVSHRLSGFGLTGWTWDQLAEYLKLNSFAVRLLFIEGLHRMLAVIEQSSDLSFLRKIADNVKVTTYLTDSSSKTKLLFDRGMSIEDIAAARNLKLSTIEDHFVELSINDPQFPLTQFVAEADVEAVVAKVDELETRRLRLLKAEFASLSYFQLRLILGARTGGDSS